jgi:Porin subfamily
MTLMKSILLGSAAGILAVASAQAADLPTRKAAPAEYVKICNVGGMAGFIIPGSDTCLKIGGYITAHFSAGNVDNSYAWTAGTLRGTSLTETSSDLRNDIGFFMRTNISLDTRTNTAYGVLRGYAELQVDTGNGFDNNTGPASTTAGSPFAFGSQAYMNLAYLQWAGITAGKAPSFFSFFGGGEGWDNLYSPDMQGFNQPLVFAYTATFGGGFSATIAAQGAAPLGASGPGTYVNIDTVNLGQQAPDIVGNVRLDQGWGSLQASGVAHEVRVVENGTFTGAGLFPSAPTQDVWGWAFNVGGKLNLPSFGPGDFIQAQFTYTENAIAYSGIPIDGGCGSWTGNGLGMSCGDTYFAGANAVGAPVWAKPTTWTVGATMEHHFSPVFSLDPEISYANLHWSNSMGQLSNNSDSWIGGVVGHWDPVPQLDFEVDLLYQSTHQSTPGNWIASGGTITSAGGVTAPAAFKANNDGFTGRLQITRSW